MRPGVVLACVVSVAALGLAIMAGGRAVSSNQSTLATPEEDAATFGSFDEKEKPPEAKGAIGAPVIDEVAPPPARVSDLPDPPPAAANPVPPWQPQDAGTAVGTVKLDSKDKRLYQPVATDTGIIQAMGYKLVIAGIDPVKPGEKCNFNGRSWPCGVRARTEFRAWLRDRAVTCKVPSKPSGRAVLTSCRAGKVDAGAWLVENGWARAQPAGPYAKAGEKARAEKRGIFGAPPSGARPVARRAAPESGSLAKQGTEAIMPPAGLATPSR
ncbi:thermonuclease family protein [Mesorhizobium sp. KR1-2]|uniref:thermonuclease family protein n=1 Tax=Mesorhizobium sp. KR1-2 TaxID=3156609 RepID=UPI0032B5DB9B